jgi:HNH endonuclease
MCLKQSRLSVAVAVDHIIAISAGGNAFPPLDGLMSCCESCHNRKTRVVEQQGKELTIKGGDERLSVGQVSPLVQGVTVTPVDTHRTVDHDASTLVEWREAVEG